MKHLSRLNQNTCLQALQNIKKKSEIRNPCHPVSLPDSTLIYQISLLSPDDEYSCPQIKLKTSIKDDQ